MDTIPKGYFQYGLLFAKSEWVRELLETQCLPENFPLYTPFSDADIAAILRERKVPKVVHGEWEILSVDAYQRHPQSLVRQLPAAFNPIKQSNAEQPCFAEILQYVSQTNFANNWLSAFAVSYTHLTLPTIYSV